MRHKISLFLLAISTWLVPVAQAQQLNADIPVGYFKAALMRADGVRSVAMYTHQQDDPRAVAGMGNAIRIAREMSEETEFDREGRPTRKRIFAAGERVQDELVMVYDAHGKLGAKSYQHFSPTNIVQPDAPWALMFEATTHYKYLQGQLASEFTQDADGKETQRIESTYDAQGRLATESRSTVRGNLLRTFTYEDRITEVQESTDGVPGRRERIARDKAGRVISYTYYTANSETPDLTEFYTYDPRGWLEEIRYEFDWTAHKREKALLSRQNRYDDHGKLVESSLNYGDGRRTVQWYDYTYYVEGE
jgi:hypothetical protein